MAGLIELRDEGLYVPRADIYIDPWKAVPRALITHAHSDHARNGIGLYVCQTDCAPILRARIGKSISIQSYAYNESFSLCGVKISFHSAGHIPGSAQVRVECSGEVWVVSGDYKTEEDGLCVPFEPVKCHVFITESTFGLPIYHWRKQDQIFAEICDWWSLNKAMKKPSVLHAYSLGKAQRLLHHLQEAGTVYVHPAIAAMNEAMAHLHPRLLDVQVLRGSISRKELESSLIITPSFGGQDFPAALNAGFSFGLASGWMQTKAGRKRMSCDAAFVLSDHADWDGLNEVVKATGAERILVTHGSTASFAAYLREQGMHAEELATLYEGDALPGGMFK